MAKMAMGRRTGPYVVAKPTLQDAQSLVATLLGMELARDHIVSPDDRRNADSAVERIRDPVRRVGRRHERVDEIHRVARFETLREGTPASKTVECFFSFRDCHHRSGR